MGVCATKWSEAETASEADQRGADIPVCRKLKADRNVCPTSFVSRKLNGSRLRASLLLEEEGEVASGLGVVGGPLQDLPQGLLGRRPVVAFLEGAHG